MEFEEFVKARQRMCSSISRCDICPLGKLDYDKACMTFCFLHPDLAEKTVSEWSMKNPVKTNADKFKEVFGAKLSRSSCDCSGIECPPNVKYCYACEYNSFWSKEYKE